jgi:hypothetical protein
MPVVKTSKKLLATKPNAPSKRSSDTYKEFDGELTNRDMLRVMRSVSRDLFDMFKFDYWSNVVIAGGYAMDLLLNTNTSDDIDMFIYNADKDLIDKIYNQVMHLTGGKVVYENGAVVTLAVNSTRKKIQVINSSDRKTPQEVVDCFDLNCCKVYFDGYNLVYNPSALHELKSRSIDLNNVHLQGNSSNRLAKYIQHKGWKLQNTSQFTQNIDPLYLFKECHFFDKTFQNLILLNNETLNNVYKKIFIRKNPNIDMIKNRKQSNYEYGKLNSAHKNIGLSSHIELRELPEESNYNQFGLPQILYNIKTGKYTFEDLYSSYDVDTSGFNTGCYMIMYEPSEEKVIEYFKNSEKFSSKNMNKYELSYVEIAALLNRTALVKFFLTKNNYKNVMKIAVHEDNVELYKMAYKLFNSDDRYLFKKPDLLRMRAYTICEELYGELKDSEKEVRSTTTKTNNQDKLKVIDTFDTCDQFFRYYCENKNLQPQILEYVKSKSAKIVTQPESFRTDSMVSIEQKFYAHEIEKINKNTDCKFNKFLKTITNADKTYESYTSTTFYNPLADLTTKYTAMEMENGVLEPTYSFNMPVLNRLLVYLDDVKLIENNKNKKRLLDNVLAYYKNDLGPNFKEFVDKHYNCLSSIKYYSKMLFNNIAHDNAYDDNMIAVDYIRGENAIGYTPDDIIIFKTIEDYHNNADPNENRSQSVKLIDRTRKIVPFTEIANRDVVRETVPGVYNFTGYCVDSSAETNEEIMSSYEKLPCDEADNVINDSDSDFEEDVKPKKKVLKKKFKTPKKVKRCVSSSSGSSSEDLSD